MAVAAMVAEEAVMAAVVEEVVVVNAEAHIRDQVSDSSPTFLCLQLAPSLTLAICSSRFESVFLGRRLCHKQVRLGLSCRLTSKLGSYCSRDW